MSTIPQVVGRTEQALTQLLFTRGIADAPIATNDQWVTLNVLTSTPDESHAVEAVRDTLTASTERVERALEDLGGAELVSRTGTGWCITERGRATLASCRRRVADLTAALTNGIAHEDLETVERVLDRVRERAVAMAAD